MQKKRIPNICLSSKILVLFSVNLLIILLTYGEVVIYKHYSIDDFVSYYSLSVEAEEVLYKSCRVFLAIVYYILDALHINVVQLQLYFGMLMLVCFSIISVLVTRYFSLLLSNNRSVGYFELLAINIGTLLIFINPFMSEWMWFSVAYVQWTGALCASLLAAIVFTKNNTRSNRIGTFLLLFIACGCYQISVAFYVFLVMFIIMKKNQDLDVKSLFVQYVFAAIPAIFSVLANIGITKILSVILKKPGETRINTSVSTLLENIMSGIKSEILLLIHGKQALPRYTLLAFFSIFLIILLCSRMKQSRMKSRILFCAFCGWVVMCLPLVVQDTFYQPPRTIAPVMAVFSVMYWGIILCSQQSDIWIRRIAMVTGAVLIIINLSSARVNANDCVTSAVAQKEELEEILAGIEAKEQETGIEVNKVAFVYDTYTVDKYYDLLQNRYFGGEMATRAISSDWSNIQALNFYSSKEYTKTTDIPDNIIQYFSSLGEQNSLNLDQQLIIENDVAYLLVY